MWAGNFLLFFKREERLMSLRSRYYQTRISGTGNRLRPKKRIIKKENIFFN
jgi:hypothetical protein